jgi:RNA polymerase sigma-70 factor (ECF subfamily)
MARHDSTADDDTMRQASAAPADARAAFCVRHRDAVRACLRRRWRHSPLRSQVDDAVQEVLLECVRPGGALDRFDPARAAHGEESFVRGAGPRRRARRRSRSWADSS